METTDSKCTQRKCREIREAQSLTQSEDASTSESAQPVQDDAISTSIAPSKTFPGVLTLRPARLAQENVVSTNSSSSDAVPYPSESPSAQRVVDEAMTNSLPSLKDVLSASTSEPAQHVRRNAGYTPLPPFSTIAYASDFPGALVVPENQGYTRLPSFNIASFTNIPSPRRFITPLEKRDPTTLSSSQSSTLDSYLLKRPFLSPRGCSPKRYVHPAIRKVESELEKCKAYFKKLTLDTKRDRAANPKLPADYMKGEFDFLTEEIERQEFKLAAVELSCTFAHTRNSTLDAWLVPNKLKKLASALKTLRAKAAEMATKRADLMNALLQLPQSRSRPRKYLSRGERLEHHIVLCTSDLRRFDREIAELEASIKHEEEKEKGIAGMEEDEDVQMAEDGKLAKMHVAAILNPGVDAGEDSKVGEVEKLTARVAQLQMQGLKSSRSETQDRRRMKREMEKLTARLRKLGIVAVGK